MNKNDLIDAVASETGLSKSEATKSVDALFDTVTSALKSGDEVRVTGFGTFAVAKRAARQGRNPRTGEVVQIAAAMQPKFRAGASLKQAVNEG